MTLTGRGKSVRSRLRRFAGKLNLVVGLLSGLTANAFAQDVISAQPGENVTLHLGINVSATIYVRIVETQTGAPAVATFWSIKELFNKDRGRHTGSAVLEVSGLRDELRAGELAVPTTFFVTADAGVWATISSSAIDEICERIGDACED